MQTSRYIVGGCCLILGVAVLVPAVFLLNQGSAFSSTWGITDIQVGRIKVSNAVAEWTLGGAGAALLFIGSVLLGKRPGSTE